MTNTTDTPLFSPHHLTGDVPARGRLQAFFRRAVREPFVHFLLAGAVIFGGFAIAQPDAGRELDERDIHVSREELLSFAQYRMRLFDNDRAEAYLAGLSPAQMRELINEYIREEALYREALAWGLDTGDYVIRRRLVQSMEFAARNMAAPSEELTEADVRNYYADNADLYTAPPTVSFTHVFFSADRHGWQEAEHRARAVAADLAPPENLTLWPGDRFLYQRAYSTQAVEAVESHFGPELAQTLVSGKAREKAWSGPYRSPYGVHLVWVADRQEGGRLSFEEARSLVERDLAEARAQAQQEAILARILGSYRVSIDKKLPEEGVPQS